MKSHLPVLLTVLAAGLFISSCAYYPPYTYTEQGAVIGAGMGALIGQAIGGDTGGTILGLTAGTILGALVGNAAEQGYQAGRDAAAAGRPVIYYDEHGRAVEAIPEGLSEAGCRMVRKRVWENGELIQETLEEICDPPPLVADAPPPPLPPPPVIYYNWWAWPFYPGVHLSWHPHYWGHPHWHHPHWPPPRPFGPSPVKPPPRPPHGPGPGFK